MRIALVAFLSGTALLTACRDSEGRIRTPVGPVRCEAQVAGRAAVVSGAVRTSNGAPVAGSRVSIGESVALTDANGHFALQGLQSGPTGFRIETPSPGFVNAVLRIVPGDNAVAFVLNTSGADAVLFGRTLDGCTGFPIGGVTIRTPIDVALSAADGTYSVKMPGGSSVTYTFSHPAYTTLMMSGPQSGTGASNYDAFLIR